MRAKALFAAAAGVLLALPALADNPPAAAPAAAAAAPTTAPAAAAAPAMSVDDIIAKNTAARGGREKLDAVQSMRVTGKMTMGPMEAPFTMEWKAPNRIRMEFVVQGQTGVQAYDGSTAWMHMPFMGKAEPEKMAEEDRADMEQQADFVGPLVDYQKKGNQVKLVGKRDVEGTDAYDLEVTLKNGDVVHELIDADSFLTIKQEAKRKQGDQELDVETSIGNYQTVNGLVLPFSMQSKIKGAPAGAPSQAITVDKYEFGSTIDDKRFTFPEKPATPAATPANPGR
jgi:outer membrane lipoprotein-sorting protein